MGCSFPILASVIIIFISNTLCVDDESSSMPEDIIEPKEFGGSYSKEKQFPFAVLIRASKDDTMVACGGSIIHPRFILTAAHCMYPSVNLQKTKIHAGAVNHRKSVYMYDLESYEIHERYDRKIENDDIALLKLAKSIRFNPYIQKLEICTERPDVGLNIILLGWGRAEREEKKLPSVLRYGLVNVISNKDCKRSYKDLANKTICVSNTGEYPLKEGIGSVIIYKGKLLGLVNLEKNGNKDVPKVCLDVTLYKSWIEERMKQLGGYPRIQTSSTEHIRPKMFFIQVNMLCVLLFQMKFEIFQ